MMRGIVGCLFLSVFLLSIGFVSAADGDVTWAKGFGGTGADAGYSTAADSNGNIYSAGYFSGTATFGGITLTSAGSQDIFVTKSDSSGNVLWAKRFGGKSQETVSSIVVYPNGDIVAMGGFSGTTNLDGATFTSAGSIDVYLLKLSGADGARIWAKSFGSTGQDNAGRIAFDSITGDIIITATINGDVDFGDGHWVF